MTIVEYARHFGSVYARQFAGRKLMQDRVEAAKRYLGGICVLILEAGNSTQTLARWMSDPTLAHIQLLRKNSQSLAEVDRIRLSAGELKSLESILFEDLALYSYILKQSGDGRACSPYGNPI